MRICLDTSAYARFKRGDGEVVDIVSGALEVGVPSVVLGELRAGFRLGARTERNEAELRAFLAQPVVGILDVDDEAASHYADIVNELGRDGTPIPTNDIWVAALAAKEGSVVVTFDRHFEAVRRVGSKILPSER